MRLFISYAHTDKAIVKDWIVRKLMVAGHDVWFDDRLIPGQDWQHQLSNEIRRSDGLVYAMTPESIVSEWCQWELAKAIEYKKPVIPVLLQTNTRIPEPFDELQYVDFSDGPTGDAVARLMGGLQHVSPTEIPSAPKNPQGEPPQSLNQDKKSQPNILIKLRRDPAVQAVIGIIGLVVAVIAIISTQGGGSNSDPTQKFSSPTPATPIVVALRDLDIRSGPGADFARLNILPVDSSLDILGISEDRLWYQVLLRDGTTGWVLASFSSARLEGDRAVVRVVIPTTTPIPTATNTATSTFTPTTTDTPSGTSGAVQVQIE